jgi:GTP diphosphokinase / guanosine-3',5'-bis(diphosphate) 3'-diphosphatase
MADTAGPTTVAAGAARQPRYLRQFELVDRVRSYDPDVDEDALDRAYVFTTVAHGSQTRLSGDPYFAHPIQVAGILTEYELDSATIIAGLLHDTIEDTTVSAEEIEQKFGPAVARIVEGVTKLSRLEPDANDPAETDRQKQAANLRKFLLATLEDVRVLLVKLADRLHNMRTLQFHPKPEKRRRISEETLEIYAPLARRIGMDRMASELEDLAFAEIHPEQLKELKSRIEAIREGNKDKILELTSKLSRILEENGIESSVYGRIKRPFSIFQKLQRKHVEFGDLSDIIGFRAIVPTAADCYKALGLIHQQWTCVSDRFADYISSPKLNGYRSIHTSIVAGNQLRVEIQIRTQEMEDLADKGVAAHFVYKTEGYGLDKEAARKDGLDAAKILAGLKEVLDHGGNAEEFLLHTRMEMFSDQIFCFTPKQRLIALPFGASALDFAYGIHSSVGDTYVGARINQEVRPNDWRLQNGDTVEIIRGPVPAVTPGFENFAKTGRALSAQRRLERSSRRLSLADKGRNALDIEVRRLGKSLADVNIEELAKAAGISSVEEFFILIGEGSPRISAVKAAQIAFPAALAFEKGERRLIDNQNARFFVQVDKATKPARGKTLKLMPCCTPVPGDRIAGVMVPRAGIEVHAIACGKLAERQEADFEWVNLTWSVDAKERAIAVGRLSISLQNVRGSLARSFALIAEYQGNIVNVEIKERSATLFRLHVEVEVHDRAHLTKILNALRTSSVVREAERVVD